MTTRKTIALTIQTFVGKVMSLPFFFFFLVGKIVSLLFKMLSRFVIVFLPKSKSLLTS